MSTDGPVGRSATVFTAPWIVIVPGIIPPMVDPSGNSIALFPLFVISASPIDTELPEVYTWFTNKSLKKAPGVPMLIKAFPGMMSWKTKPPKEPVGPVAPVPLVPDA
jgi:hypothetical protein